MCMGNILYSTTELDQVVTEVLGFNYIDKLNTNNS
jgi:hypothetical protein